MAFSLDRVLKALLFGASGPLTIKDIQRVFTKFHEQNEAEDEPIEEAEDNGPEQPFLQGDGMPTSEVPSLVTAAQIREAMDRIASELEEADEVFRLVERHNGYMLMSSPSVGEWIRLLRDEPRPLKLNQAAMETLAVIAYRQPVVRAEVEKIRGVSIDSALNRLMERDLVQIIGRADLPGRPLQYGTTEEFLEFVGIKSIEELPASDVLSPRQIDEWLHEVSNKHEPNETDMGLPEGDSPEDEEGGQGQGPRREPADEASAEAEGAEEGGSVADEPEREEEAS